MDLQFNTFCGVPTDCSFEKTFSSSSRNGRSFNVNAMRRMGIGCQDKYFFNVDGLAMSHSYDKLIKKYTNP